MVTLRGRLRGPAIRVGREIRKQVAPTREELEEMRQKKIKQEQRLLEEVKKRRIEAEEVSKIKKQRLKEMKKLQRARKIIRGEDTRTSRLRRVGETAASFFEQGEFAGFGPAFAIPPKPVKKKRRRIKRKGSRREITIRI